MAHQLISSMVADGTVIDLTSDDDGHVAQTLPLLHLAGSTPNGVPSRPAGASHCNSDRLPNPLAQELEERGQDPRPPKRRRTEEPSSEPSAHEQGREDIAAALGRCLEEQVFPHVERATDKLPSDIYDLDRLGAKVIRTIVNKEFERHFNQGNGRLTSATESTIAAGVHRLVVELASSPVCAL